MGRGHAPALRASGNTKLRHGYWPAAELWSRDRNQMAIPDTISVATGGLVGAAHLSGLPILASLQMSLPMMLLAWASVLSPDALIPHSGDQA